MRMKIIETLIFLKFVIFDRFVFARPVTVPTRYDDHPFNKYSYQNYVNDDISPKPNSHFNRLPPNAYQAQIDDYQDDGANDDDIDYNDQQSDKPVTNAQQLPQQFDINNILNSNFVQNEDRFKKKKKKKRRIKRPCIPIQSYGSPLFSNRLKREHKSDDDDRNRESGKTLGLLFGGLGGGGYPGYYPGNFGGYGGYYPQQIFGGYRPQYDNVRPQASYDVPQYNPSGGYPCIPVNMGHHQQQQSFKPQGGFLSGLFNDFNYGNYGNFPPQNNYNVNNNFNNRPTPPQYDQQTSSNYSPNRPNRPPLGPLNDYTSTGKPLWEGIVDRVQEFVTSLNPQQLFTTLGDSLQGVAQSIQNATPVSSAADAVKSGYNEFRSLLFR